MKYYYSTLHASIKIGISLPVRFSHARRNFITSALAVRLLSVRGPVHGTAMEGRFSMVLGSVDSGAQRFLSGFSHGRVV